MGTTTAVAVVVPSAVAAMANPGPHGFTEVLYAFTSQTGNNGSAFAGLSGNIPFYNLAGAIAMLVGDVRRATRPSGVNCTLSGGR